MINTKSIYATWHFVVKDYHSWPLRFVLEVFAWTISIGAAILFAFTVPNIPFVLFLSMTITCSAIYTWASWTRGSFGMLANYLLLTALDVIAFSRVLIYG